MNVLDFVYLSADGHLGHFHSLAIVSNPAGSICMCARVFVSPGEIDI